MPFSAHLNRALLAASFCAAFLPFLSGCASPAAPKPPSLHLPASPKDLAALRRGDEVEVSFTAPSRTTDGLLLKESVLHARACIRPAATAACTPIALNPSQNSLLLAPGAGKGAHVSWNLGVPAALREGPLKAAAVEVELLNDSGNGAGWSAPAWFAAGAAPPDVVALEATGTRGGVLLRWQPVHDGGEVLLQRTQLQPDADNQPQKVAGQEITLQADPGDPSASETVDGAMKIGIPMRYVAYRSITAQLGGHRLEVQSAPSHPLVFTWRDVYPPPAPKNLRAVGFTESSAPHESAGPFSVDLIWDPVEDQRVTGYLVTRTLQHRQGAGTEQPVLLTRTPVETPAFHDTTASRGEQYEYAVTAVDAAGNRSAADTTLFDAQ